MFIETSAKAGYNVKQVRCVWVVLRRPAADAAACAQTLKGSQCPSCLSNWIFRTVSLFFFFCPNLITLANHEAIGRPLVLRKGRSSSRKGHDLFIHFTITTDCISPPPPLSSCQCLWRCVRVPVGVGACVCCGARWLVAHSSQTDNHRGGWTESERDECSVYWNKCKDRLQCQTGRACAPFCVCVFIVLMLPDRLLFHTRMNA